MDLVNPLYSSPSFAQGVTSVIAATPPSLGLVASASLGGSCTCSHSRTLSLELEANKETGKGEAIIEGFDIDT